MCLAVPFEIKEIRGDGTALAERGGLIRTVDVSFIREIKPGDHVIVHAGFAIEKINVKQAEKARESYEELLSELKDIVISQGETAK